MTRTGNFIILVCVLALGFMVAHSRYQVYELQKQNDTLLELAPWLSDSDYQNYIDEVPQGYTIQSVRKIPSGGYQIDYAGEEAWQSFTFSVPNGLIYQTGEITDQGFTPRLKMEIE